MSLGKKSIWKLGMSLGLGGILIAGSAASPGSGAVSAVAAAPTEVPHPPMDEVWDDDSDLQLNDDIGVDNPTWEDYEQDADIDFEEEQNKNEENNNNNNNSNIVNLPQVGSYYSSDQATYVVTKAAVTGGTVEYRGPVGELASVNLPDYVLIESRVYDVTAIGKNAFKDNKILQSVSTGSTVTLIDTGAFSGCSGLSSVVFGNDLKRIGDNAFYNCGALTKLSLPATVKKIGKKAFAGCKALKNITIRSKTLKAANIGKNAFSNISKNAVIKVPKAKVKAYRKLFRKKGLSTKAKVKSI